VSASDTCREWLFHGPALKAITEIDGTAEHAIHAALDASVPPPALRGIAQPGWLIDPVIFDSALQLFIIWARAHLDKTPLPSRFGRFRRFGSLSDVKLQCHVHILEPSRDPPYYLDVAFVGPDGRLRGLLEGMEGTCSRALNRLAAVPAGRRPAAESVGESPSV